jgi:hypothetical protein
MLESCFRSFAVSFQFWLCDASSAKVRCRALRAANHFGIIEVLDAQMYRDLKMNGTSVKLKRDANVSTLLASPGRLYACHFDLELAHGLTRIGPARGPHRRRDGAWRPSGSAKVVGLVLVQEAGNLSPQRRCLQPAAHGTGVIEELLNLCWDRGRRHCDVGPIASERMLPSPREDGVAIPIFVRTRNVCLFSIVCHPFFVLGQRDVALFELAKFPGFGRRTSRFQ